MFRNVPSWTFGLPMGLRTNVNPLTIAGEGLDTATNVHFYEEFRSIGKMYGTTAVSGDLGGSVDFLGFSEMRGLDRGLLREAVAIANGAVRVWDTGTTWDTPALPAGATITQGDTWHGATMIDRYHFSAPDQFQLGTGGLKWDGTRVTNWGVEAPGTQKTELEALDSAANWTASTDATDANSTTTIGGGGSVQVTKTGTSTTLANISRNTLAHDVSAAGQDAGYCYLFLSSGVLQALEQTEWTAGVDTAAVEIRITANTASDFTNSDYYVFDVGDLVPGWNLLTWVWSSPSGSTGTGIDTETTDIGSIQLQIKGNSTAAISGDQYVLWDHLYIVDEGAPIAVDDNAGAGPDGTYSYVVTYVTEYGLESNAGPASNSVTVTDDTVSVTAVPVSTDDQVIERRIYRDISGDGVYRYVGSLYDNESTDFTDNVADASLSLTQPPFAGDSVFDNSPPGRMKDVIRFGDRIVGISDDGQTLYISEAGSPEAFRIIDRIVPSFDMQALEVYEPGVIVYGSDVAYFLHGDGLFTPFQFHPFGAEMIGANGPDSTARIKGGNVALHEERLLWITTPEDPWVLNAEVQDQFTAVSDLAGLQVIHDPKEHRLLLFGNGTEVIVYQYGTQAVAVLDQTDAGRDALDTRVGAYCKYDLPVTPTTAAMMESTADVPEVWFGASDGYVYKFDPTATTYANGASTSNITMTLETHWVPLIQQGRSPQMGGRGEPRYLEITQQAAGACVYTITVTLARSPDVDNTTPITVSWSQTVTGNESLIVPVPMQGAGRGEWCKVKLVSTSADTPVIRDLKLHYIPRGIDFRGPRT